jgi:Phage portal protein
MRWPWSKREEVQRSSLDDLYAWLNSFSYNGNAYSIPAIQQTLAGEMEPTPQGFTGFAQQGFGGNAVVFACMALRQLVFSGIRFQWQTINSGRPADLFGNSSLRPLEVPWPGGTTQDLLNRMIQDADLAGNFYAVRDTPLARIGGDTSTFEIVRLRPDWVMHARVDRVIRGGIVGHKRLGIAYFEGGTNSGNEPVAFQHGEFAHFAPLPDPLADWRGMSWLTPVAREVQADAQMTTHKQKYFEHGATPNLIIKYPAGASETDMKAVQKLFNNKYEGVDNAYKTLHIGGGADATIVGHSMEQVNFQAVQGAGESRIAAAAGTPPAILGTSDGLSGSSLNSGNYKSARRRMADATVHPLWMNAAGSLAPLIATDSALGANKLRYESGGMRLWYDPRDVPFLREDEQDISAIGQTQAITIRQYIDAGFEPVSAVKAVDSGDLTVLKHTGLFSVQLQPPNSSTPDPNAPIDTPKTPADKPMTNMPNGNGAKIGGK